VVDTNCDPDQVDFPVPGNDDALRAIRLFASRMADSILEGRAFRESHQAEAAEGAEGQALPQGGPAVAQQRRAPRPAATQPVEPATSTASA